MATTETEIAPEPETTSAASAPVQVQSRKQTSILDKALRLLSSVRFGVVMLGILLSCCMIGMLVMQVNVDGFDEYYRQLKPAQREIYSALGFFDIYRSRYFTLLLAITGLNIILASIDRFPAAWSYVVKPKLSASPKFISAQMFNDQAEDRQSPEIVSERIKTAWRKMGFRGRIAEENGRLTVFAQRNTWNRLGAYSVHVALITIFIGGFLTSRYGVGGQMEIRPGRTSKTFVTQEITTEGTRQAQVSLPFEIECRDIQQKLIRPEGALEAQNTIDWLSAITIRDKDEGVTEDLLVHLNYPQDYRGYRFFQSEFVPVGHAREIVITFEPATGGGTPVGPVKVLRNGSTEVPGVGTVHFEDFFPDFSYDDKGPTTISREYNNPAAQLQVTTPDGKQRVAFAFNPKLADELLTRADAKIQQDGGDNPLLINGQKVILREFEKSSLAHTLTIQYDPGRLPVYIGFTLLSLSLCGVFFFSHQRVWAVIEPQGRGSKVHFGGHTNRNRPAFEGRFNSLVEAANGGPKDE
jgi:cytochrome c biogenesis protein